MFIQRIRKRCHGGKVENRTENFTFHLIENEKAAQKKFHFE